MGISKYLLIVLFLLSALALKAQVTTFQSADSTSEALYAKGDWKQLIEVARRSIKDGIDFPLLRLKTGYAFFILGNYSAALAEYDRVLADDAFNQTARYYEYLCYKYLNDDLLAINQASALDTTSYNLLKINRSGLISAALESSFKTNNDPNRGNASYTRFGLSNTLFKKLKLDQSASYFGQQIGTGENDDQFEYFAQISYAFHNRISVFGGWHYMNTSYEGINYNSHLFLAGVNYSGTYFDIAGDINAGHILNEASQQIDAKLRLYPLGNLNLYFIERGSYLHNSARQHMVYSQLVGFKAANKVWLETNATFGNQADYIDRDGLYIYNTFDDTKLKFGESVYYQLDHLQLQLNYSYENKSDALQAITYHQHSFTAGILWKF